jgi:hypothetical protein
MAKRRANGDKGRLARIREYVTNNVSKVLVAALVSYATNFAHVPSQVKILPFLHLVALIPLSVVLICFYVILGIIAAITVFQATIALYLRTSTMTKKKVLLCVVLSVTCCILCFATIYEQLSYDSTAFNTQKPLSVISALYFSIVTFATVGYGDITPQTDLTRAIVAFEIIVALFYNFLILSLIAGFIREDASPIDAVAPRAGDYPEKNKPAAPA